MKNVKSYKDYCNEEVSFRKAIAGAALTGALALGSPASSQVIQKDTIQNNVSQKQISDQDLMSSGKGFKITPEGITPKYVVVNVDKTQAELYKKTLGWISHTYDTPSSVIKSQIENEYIRFTGIEKGLYRQPFMGSTQDFDIKYEIEISFKDGKYKFELVGLEISYTVGERPHIWTTSTKAGVFNGNDYNKKGELKAYAKYFHEVPEYFNKLNINLLKYLEGETSKTKSDW